MQVTIIGGSAPGLFAAYLFASAGARVGVYERASVLGSPLRTLIVTRRINEVLGFVPEEAITNQISRFDLFSRSESGRIKLTEPDLIIERGRLIELLARRALEKGVAIHLNQSFRDFAQVGRKVVASFKDLATAEEHHVRSDVLVGADGTFSAVSRAASRNGHHLTSLLQARVPLPENLDRSTVQVWFDAGRTKYFYWIIPESEGVAAVGLIADDARQAGAQLTAFLEERQWTPLDFQASMIPMHKFEDPNGLVTLGRNVYLIGDAAAQVKVTTVGGVVTGLRGAKALVDVIVHGRDVRGELQRLKRELDLHLLLRQLLNAFTDDDYDELIRMLDGKLRGVVAERTRDELGESFLKLIRAEPRLMKLGARALLRMVI
ncbi:MAG: NAD(P)/FAD-dependent oxidoreductase [Acidobacteria bacterium]|nr:NAD(P)/FAD-dependent oxidoreductase [Acidobacteriota bacterium]